jgi:hypothetical protein
LSKLAATHFQSVAESSIILDVEQCNIFSYLTYHPQGLIYAIGDIIVHTTVSEGLHKINGIMQDTEQRN